MATDPFSENLTTACSSADTWNSWAITTSAGSDYIWHYWTGGTGDENGSLEIEPPSSEEIERERQERKKQEIENRKREKEKQRAERKARRLLFELIGKSEYREFCKSGYVDVEGKSGKIYRIEPRHQIKVFDGKDKLDVAIESLCITTPNYYLPKADEIIWKKLLIEADEEELLKVANHF